jgi:hypothetical protein
MPRDLSIARTIAATVPMPPIYFPAPSDTPRITGLFCSCAVSSVAFVHSRLLILNCPTAYLPSKAFFNMSFAFTIIILIRY